MMVRLISLTGVLGVLVAGALYAGSTPAWRNAIAPLWRGTSGPAPEAKLTTEDWPICTTTEAMGSEAEWAQLDWQEGARRRGLERRYCGAQTRGPARPAQRGHTELHWLCLSA